MNLDAPRTCPAPCAPQELELAAYLLHCERRLGEEYERCEGYLGRGMRKRLKDIVDRCLLEAHLAAILDASKGLMAACAEADLARLYTCVGSGGSALRAPAPVLLKKPGRCSMRAHAARCDHALSPPCSMCSRIGALQGLRLVFRDYIRTAGATVVTDEHKVRPAASRGAGRAARPGIQPHHPIRDHAGGGDGGPHAGV